MLPVMFWLIWPSGFRGDLKKIGQSETRIGCGDSVKCLYYTLHVGNHILIFFLGRIAKGNVDFWHHIVSVVCCLSSVNFSHFNLLL
jgi:hypothetical protein